MAAAISINPTTHQPSVSDGRLGGRMRSKNLECKDRAELGSVILPFVGPNSFNRV